MAKPKIRHIALYARNPEQLARFYEQVFGMEIVHRSTSSKSVYLSDGYLTLAVLQHQLERSEAVGLNHFGFEIDSTAEIARRLSAWNIEEPAARPSNRPYAEHRAVDPEGNQFDLSEHGYQRVEYQAERRQRHRAPDAE